MATQISLRRRFRTERGSATRSGGDGSEAFGLSDDVNSGDVLRLTEPRSNRNAVAAFSPALEQSDHTGGTGKMKTTLKELHRGGGGFDSTPSELMNWGTVSQGRRSSPLRRGPPTLG